jgi:hypothetical protein
MPNGGNQGVLQHPFKCNPAQNVKIKALKVTSGADKITPNFIILLNQAVPGTHMMEKQQSSIMQSLNRALCISPSTWRFD